MDDINHVSNSQAQLDITVRPLNESDRSEWEALWKKYNTDQKTGTLLNATALLPANINKSWRDLFETSSNKRGFAAIDSDGKLMGFLHREIKPSDSGGPDNYYMEDLYSDGRGTGAVLMEALRHEALDAGSERVYWECFNNNPKGLIFYRGLQGVILTRLANPPLTNKNTFDMDLDIPIRPKLPDLGLIGAWKKEAGLPGVGVVIRDDSGVIFSKGFDVPDDVIIAIASQSKTLTAVAILKLIENGMAHPLTGRPLSLDDEITDLLPNFKGAEWLIDEKTRRSVTLRDALCHQTKFGKGYYKKEWGKRLPSFDELRTVATADIDEVDAVAIERERASGAEVDAEKKVGYSNRMYNFLGVIIEDVARTNLRSDMTFNDYITEEIVKAHDLGEIYPSLNAVPEGNKGRILIGYSGENLDTPVHEQDSAGTTPCGGFFATIEAMSGFFHKLAKGEILQNQTAANETGLWERLREGRNIGWAGLGTQMMSFDESDHNGNKSDYCVVGGRGKIYGHTGGLDGFQSETWYHPESGLTVSLYRNGYYVPGWEVAEEKYREIVNEDNVKRGTPHLVQKIFQAITDVIDTFIAKPDRPIKASRARARRKDI